MQYFMTWFELESTGVGVVAAVFFPLRLQRAKREVYD